MNMRSVFIALFFVVLVACDNRGDDRNTSTSEFTSQTPALLRSIPAANLTARVSIDNETTTYRGENYPDGNWIITVDVMPNQNYDIFIEWLHLETLLMEERGSFFTDPGNPVIELDLNFITSGLPQFDNDCDGLSNLEEIMAGSDPEIAESTLQNACNTEPEVPEDPNAIMSPWVGQSFSSIGSIGLTDRVTHFSQAIQIKTHSVNLSSSYGFTISTDAQAGLQHQATLRLYHHPTFGKQARLSVTNALSFEASSVTGSDCVPLNTSGLFCTIPLCMESRTLVRADL